MASEAYNYDESFIAGEDLSSSQYFFVYLSAADTVSIATSPTAQASTPIGVLQNDPSSSQAAIVRLHGISRLSANGAISTLDLVTSSTDGQGVTATTANEMVLGRANSASTAAAQLIELVMTGPSRFSST